MAEIDRDIITRIADEAAEKAARQTVRETFRLFGVDIDRQREVNEFRADLITARKVRRFLDSAFGRIAGLVFIALIIGALVSAGDWLKSVAGWKS